MHHVVLVYDPESLLSGAEVAQGMNYANSHRNWPNEQLRLAAMRGELTTETILKLAPRVRHYHGFYRS